MKEETLLSVIKKKNIIPLKSLSKYFWQDEINDQFLLTRAMEIFLYSNKWLSLYVFNRKVLARMRKEGLIFDIIELDDPFTECRTNIENLPYLLSLSKPFTKRPRKRGKWICKMENILAHKIIPFNIKKDVKGKMPIKCIEELKKYRERKMVK